MRCGLSPRCAVPFVSASAAGAVGGLSFCVRTSRACDGLGALPPMCSWNNGTHNSDKLQLMVVVLSNLRVTNFESPYTDTHLCSRRVQLTKYVQHQHQQMFVSLCHPCACIALPCNQPHPH